VPAARLRPFAAAEVLRARERPGFEIDARAWRRETRLAVGTDLRLGTRTQASVQASRRAIAFDADAVFDGSHLAEALNRSEAAVSVGVRRALTPLTSLSVTVDVERHRFAAAADRDADAVRVLPRLDLAPSALISGSVALGVRRARMRAAAAPPFNGVAGAAAVSYTLLGATRLSFRLERDLEYSYDRTWPYYVSTATGGAVRQRIAGPWEVQFSAGRQRLRYVALRGSGGSRLDHVTSVGGGTSYRLGPATRLVFNVDRVRRDSELPLRAYSGLQSGVTVAYGF
jgi:hypothetical protein